MATQLGLYKAALLILKESSALTITLTTDSVAVNILNTVYSDCLQHVLEQSKWNHAARSMSIEADEDVEPEFGYSGAFAKPDDYCNLIAISSSSTFYPPFGPNEYRDEGGYWFANCDPLYVSIVSNDNAYGGDLSLWPAIVARALEYEIAFRAAPSLTSMGEQAMDQLEKRKRRALLAAQSWDASKQPPEQPAPSRLATARAGRTAWRESWRP